jgi:hypothetical protein
VHKLFSLNFAANSSPETSFQESSMPKKKTNLLQRGETQEHRRWKVESLDSEYLRKNRGKWIKGKKIGVLRERVKVVEPVRGTWDLRKGKGETGDWSLKSEWVMVLRGGEWINIFTFVKLVNLIRVYWV